ncbi:MAG: NAD(P)H-dependent oxidoreductase [Gammaproteobacteria bacterium]|nr:NAD(P)H-dependent oxidoreductase [Gammaproteobacteria bacterium]
MNSTRRKQSEILHATVSYFACLAILMIALENICEAAKVEKNMTTRKIIFLNASKNREGNTATLAKIVLRGLDYKFVNLVDYHINQIDQESKTDQKMEVIDQLEHSNVIVIGTPVYWSDMTGYLKTFIDRLSLDTDKDRLKGADVYLIIQGTEPSDAINGITTVIEHVSKRFKLNYKGLIRNEAEACSVNKQLSK